MKQLTIRGFDEQLEAALRKLARSEGISLSRAAVRLLRKAAGLGEGKPRREVVGSSLDQFIGTWTKAQAREVSRAVKDFERIDESMWA